MNGLILTVSAWDFITIVVPPKPERTPMTNAKSIMPIPFSETALSTIKMGKNRSMITRSAKRISSVSMIPP